MKKLRALTPDEHWVLETVLSTSTPYWKLCVAWASEMGTSGNVVQWPKSVVSSALNELEARGLIAFRQPSQRSGGAA